MTVTEYNTAVDDYADNLYRFALKHLRNEDSAKDIMRWILDKTIRPRKVFEIDTFGTSHVQLGDIVKINYPILGLTESTNKYIVTRCTLDYREGVSTAISCRAI